MARAAADLPPEIEDLDEYDENMNFLCHADTGSGKTVMWSQLPNVLIVAVEEGAIAAKRWLRNHPRPKSLGIIKVRRVRHWDDLIDVFEWVRDNPGVFEWVLIDSITKAQTRCILAIMENVVSQNPKRDPDIPAPGDHFKWQLLMKRMVQDWNELPVNMVWLARSMNKEDPDGDDIVVPLIEGKDYQISAWVSGEVHLLCYLKKEKRGEKMVRVLYTNEHPMYWCKDRYDVLPHKIVNPDANKIVKMIVDSGASADMGDESQPKKRATTKRVAATKRRRKTSSR